MEPGLAWMERFGGGEFLVGDYSHFVRVAHLRPVPMPGGEMAVREPWRMAFSYALDAQVDSQRIAQFSTYQQRQFVEQMIQREFRSPRTSSAGRLFDAAAAIVGLGDRVSYEGQAASQLEWLAAETSVAGTYPFELVEEYLVKPAAWGDLSACDQYAREVISGSLQIDTRPLVRGLFQDVQAGSSPAVMARRFHSTLVRIISATCCRIRTKTGAAAVVLSGGCFMNALLTSEVSADLIAAGFRVYRHRIVPPNDGGISLGQLAIAAQSPENGYVSGHPG
jgi:hydrogenase maturation protein HypF